MTTNLDHLEFVTPTSVSAGQPLTGFGRLAGMTFGDLVAEFGSAGIALLRHIAGDGAGATPVEAAYADMLLLCLDEHLPRLDEELLDRARRSRWA